MIESSRKVILLLSADQHIIDYFLGHFKEEFVILHFKTELSLLECIRKTVFHLLIIDEKIRGIEIFKLSAKLKKEGELKLLPFLLITTHLDKSYLRKAIHAGITEFLYLPLQVKQVKFHIDEAFKSQSIQEKMLGLSSQIGEAPPKKPSAKTRHYNFLLNERALEEVITAKKMGKPLALLLLQVNHVEKFKQSEESINELLTDFLKHYLRPHDLLFPQGKGKLFIMFPRTSKRAASLIAETIEKEIKKKSFSLEGAPISFTFSSRTCRL